MSEILRKSQESKAEKKLYPGLLFICISVRQRIKNHEYYGYEV